MILLTSTSDLLRVITSTGADIDVHASFVDLSGTTVTPGRTNTAITTAATTTVVGSPGASTQRNVKTVAIRNKDVTDQTITIIHTDGTTTVEVIEAVVKAGESFHYDEDQGWQVFGGGVVVADEWTYVILGADFANSTTSNLASNLFFTPEANKKYVVEVWLYLQSAATTTGARPGISWPTGLDQNAAWAMSPSSATAFVSRFWGNTSAANAAATGVPVANNDVFGMINAMFVTGGSPSGNFTITLASEIAASEARIMANSFLRYREIS